MPSELSKRLEAERRGLIDGFNGNVPSEFLSHYYTWSYNKGYKKGMKILKKNMRK